jgi:hypothetical protein
MDKQMNFNASSFYKVSCNRMLWVSLVALCLSSTAFAKGELSAKQARKLISSMPGLALKSGAVHLNSVRSIDASTAQATAEIVTAFRFEKSDTVGWNVVEFRTGQDRWESLALLSQALSSGQRSSSCDSSTIVKGGINLTNRQARCLLAELLAIQTPSDAVRIKEVSTLALPLSSKTSALVDAVITADFQFSKGDKGAWRVSGLRTGAHNWIDPENLLERLGDQKAATARAELNTLAGALEDFKKRRGSYVATKSEAVLVDVLSPHYLARVIRLDPWHRPYAYEGTRENFTLRSRGRDGKENTDDDIVVTPSKSPN